MKALRVSNRGEPGRLSILKAYLAIWVTIRTIYVIICIKKVKWVLTIIDYSCNLTYEDYICNLCKLV